MEIKNKAFRQAMENAGLGKVRLWKQDGYFHIYSDDEEWGDFLSSFRTVSIYRQSFNSCPVGQWVEDIRGVFEHEAACRGVPVEGLWQDYKERSGIDLDLPLVIYVPDEE